MMRFVLSFNKSKDENFHRYLVSGKKDRNRERERERERESER